jgi:hypothetical protein
VIGFNMPTELVDAMLLELQIQIRVGETTEHQCSRARYRPVEIRIRGGSHR